MTTALDTNILSGLFVRDARTALLETHLLQCQSEGPLQISPVVLAETLARPGVDEAFLLKFLRDTAIQVGYRMYDAVWSLAGIGLPFTPREGGKRFARVRVASSRTSSSEPTR